MGRPHRWPWARIALILCIFWRPAWAQQPVDLQLILAVDVSASIDFNEFNLEVEGYVRAFRHPDVLRAIQAGPMGKIAVTLVQWAGRFQQRTAIEWVEVGDAASAARLADEIAEMPRFFEGATALGEAVWFAVPLFEQSPHQGRRRVIDVSGDGMSNEGRIASQARDEAARWGITINGLAIVNEEPHLESFYRQFLITGPSAFVIVARDFSAFAEAILAKLIREITGELVSEEKRPYLQAELPAWFAPVADPQR